MTCWEILEIEPTTDLQAIKRAYAHKFKRLQLENKSDRSIFIPLKQALEDALSYARTQAKEEADSAHDDITRPVSTVADEVVTPAVPAESGSSVSYGTDSSAGENADNETREGGDFIGEFYRLFESAKDEPYEWVDLLNEDKVPADKNTSTAILDFLIEQDQRSNRLHPSILRQLDRLFEWSTKGKREPQQFTERHLAFIATLDDEAPSAPPANPNAPAEGGDTLGTLFFLIGFLLLVVLICIQAIK